MNLYKVVLSSGKTIDVSCDYYELIREEVAKEENRSSRWVWMLEFFNKREGYHDYAAIFNFENIAGMYQVNENQ